MSPDAGEVLRAPIGRHLVPLRKVEVAPPLDDVAMDHPRVRPRIAETVPLAMMRSGATQCSTIGRLWEFSFLTPVITFATTSGSVPFALHCRAIPPLAATCPGQRPPRSDLRSLVGGRPRKGDLPLAPRLSLSCVLPEIVPSQARSSDRVSRPHTSSVWSAKRPLWFARRTERRRWVLVRHKGLLPFRARHRSRNI